MKGALTYLLGLLLCVGASGQAKHGLPFVPSLGPLRHAFYGPTKNCVAHAGVAFYVKGDKVFGGASLMSLSGRGGPLRSDIERTLKAEHWRFVKKVLFIPSGNTPVFSVFQKPSGSGVQELVFGSPTGSPFLHAFYRYELAPSEAAKFRSKYGTRYGLMNPLSISFK